jgi:hypothetical protein
VSFDEVADLDVSFSWWASTGCDRSRWRRCVVGIVGRVVDAAARAITRSNQAGSSVPRSKVSISAAAVNESVSSTG